MRDYEENKFRELRGGLNKVWAGNGTAVKNGSSKGIEDQEKIATGIKGRVKQEFQ